MVLHKSGVAAGRSRGGSDRRVRLRPAEDPAAWNALARSFAHSTPFHGFEFLMDMSALFGWRFRPMVAESDGSPVGVVPLVALAAMPATPRIPFPYVGPLVASSDLRATLHAIRRWQRRSGHIVARLALAPAAGPVAVSGIGLDLSVRETYELDLEHGSTRRYEAGLRPDRRQALRRAARAGLTAEKTRPGEVAELLPRLLSNAYARHGGTPPYPSGVAAWIDARVGTDAVSAVTVRDLSGPIGLLVALRHGDSTFGWLGASERTGAARDAGTVAYDALIRDALRAGVRRFDFVGHVDAGVGRFKRSFGARAMPFWDVTSSLLPFDVDRLADLRQRGPRRSARWSRGVNKRWIDLEPDPRSVTRG